MRSEKKKEELDLIHEVKIFYHESLVTFGLTKPTGNSNRCVQMGMNGQKIADRLYP